MDPISTIDISGLAAKDADDFEEINAELRGVAARRRPFISLLDEPYRRSKIAWKVALFSNSILYRFISLAEGVALSWNAGNQLSAILNGRAMVETTAVFWDFGEKLSKFAKENDFASLDALAMNRLFGTRDEQMLEDHPELKALQVLSAIDKIDKTLIPHFRSHYDRLSERCHPNSAGHREMFSKLDKENGQTIFRVKNDPRNLTPLKCALGTAAIIKHIMQKVDVLVPEIANAHHGANPSPLVDD